eukprot:TRINITY_DN29337_c0_g1_i1.p1 TRINITY_DN29337_c0_g1~~TRINITY_DN29337_c0_g1_i1.p1  ORF type:complete len:499 (+),score=153.64 TRINITY_DN29337_c0_g1_i1:117-1613(+)
MLIFTLHGTLTRLARTCLTSLPVSRVLISSLSTHTPHDPSTMSYPEGFIKFVNEAVTPFHAVDESRKRLKEAGYEYLSESDSWANIKRGGKYFFTRNESSFVAFAVGGKYQAGNGFNIVATHTDSPDLKVKPRSASKSAGFLEVGVCTYGGGIWHTWFDRDLTVAGRVVVKEDDGTLRHRLVNLRRPIMRVPTLAIHLDRGVNDAFKLNKETHVHPILATAIKGELEGKSSDDRMHPLLVQLLADEAGCKPEQIRDFDLDVVDTQPAAIGGAKNEFIFSPRLDNLCMTYCGLQAMCEAGDSGLDEEPNVRIMAAFDHEEVGSVSTQGAASSLMEDTLRRITAVLGGDDTPRDAFEQAARRSLLVSADMAHAHHPNYTDKHEQNHKPHLHEGPVVKFNANQRYATNAFTANVIHELGRDHDIPIQDFVVKNDSPCGSTIGPMMSANLGIRTVDIGNPMLSMHSIREMCGTDDVTHAVNLFKHFYIEFTARDSKVVVEHS